MTSVPPLNEAFNDNNDNDRAKLLRHWQQFATHFPDENICKAKLYEMMDKENVLECHHCGHHKLEKNPIGRVLKCSNCNKGTWFTAGTFFHHVKLIRPWLAAIWLMERGVIFSASAFCKLAGISSSSALYILKKLTFVLTKNMNQNTISAPSSAFIEVICKRSRQTPPNMHPRAEQDLINKELEETSSSERIDSQSQNSHKPSSNSAQNADNSGKLKNANDLELNEEEQKVYNLLLEKTFSSEELHVRIGISISELYVALVMLELKGAIERLPGDRYCISTEPNELATTQTDEIKDAVSIINFIRINFHGISRKYLQNYLALHWYYAKNIYDTGDSIFRLCLQAIPLRYTEILNYKSPAYVMVWDGQKNI